MRKLLFVMVLLFSSLSVYAQGAGQTGVGIMLGNPTGLNVKKWTSDTQAIDAGAGISIGKHTNFSMHSDYLWHSKDALYFHDTTPLDLYYGLGGRMEFADSIELGLRVPIGVAHNLADSKSDMFAEIAPIADFVNSKRLEIHLTFGARYYLD